MRGMTTPEDTNDAAEVASPDRANVTHYGAPSNLPMSSAGSPTGYDPLGGYVVRMTSLLPGAFGNPASAAGSLGDYDARAAHAALRDLIGREPGFVQRRREDGILPSIMEATGPLGKYGRAVVSGETISTPLPPRAATVAASAMPALIEAGDQRSLTPITDHLGAAIPAAVPEVRLPAGVSVNNGAVQYGSVSVPLPQRAEQLLNTAGQYGVRVQNGQPSAAQPVPTVAPPGGFGGSSAGTPAQSLAQVMDARYAVNATAAGKTAVDHLGKPVKRRATGVIVALIMVLAVVAVVVIAALFSGLRPSSNVTGSGDSDGGAAESGALVADGVDWTTYPGYSADLADFTLDYPSAEAQIGAADTVANDIMGIVTVAGGGTWDSYGSSPQTSYGLNVYGGQSLLQQYVGATWRSSAMIGSDALKAKAAFDIVDYLHANGYSYVYLQTDTGGDIVEVSDKAEALNTLSDPENTGLWEFSAFADDALYSSVTVRFTDAINDPGGHVSQGYKDSASTLGYPLASISVQTRVYDALADADRSRYFEQLAAFDGLTPPEGY